SRSPGTHSPCAKHSPTCHSHSVLQRSSRIPQLPHIATCISPGRHSRSSVHGPSIHTPSSLQKRVLVPQFPHAIVADEPGVQPPASRSTGWPPSIDASIAASIAPASPAGLGPPHPAASATKTHLKACFILVPLRAEVRAHAPAGSITARRARPWIACPQKKGRSCCRSRPRAGDRSRPPRRAPPEPAQPRPAIASPARGGLLFPRSPATPSSRTTRTHGFRELQLRALGGPPARTLGATRPTPSSRSSPRAWAGRSCPARSRRTEGREGRGLPDPPPGSEAPHLRRLAQGRGSQSVRRSGPPRRAGCLLSLTLTGLHAMTMPGPRGG